MHGEWKQTANLFVFLKHEAKGRQNYSPVLFSFENIDKKETFLLFPLKSATKIQKKNHTYKKKSQLSTKRVRNSKIIVFNFASDSKKRETR